jgi:Protein of unknown function (DUF2569)
MGLGQILGPLRTLAEMAEAARLPVDAAAEAAFKIIPGASILVSVEDGAPWVLLALTIVSTVIFFRKSRHFPKVFIGSWLALIAYHALDFGVAAIVLRDYLTPAQLFDSMMADKTNMKAVVSIFMLIPWVLYVLKSERVKNTFIK